MSQKKKEEIKREEREICFFKSYRGTQDEEDAKVLAAKQEQVKSFCSSHLIPYFSCFFLPAFFHDLNCIFYNWFLFLLVLSLPSFFVTSTYLFALVFILMISLHPLSWPEFYQTFQRCMEQNCKIEAEGKARCCFKYCFKLFRVRLTVFSFYFIILHFIILYFILYDIILLIEIL